MLFISQVILKRDDISIIFFNRNVAIPDLRYPENGQELQEILERINGLYICVGGPKKNVISDLSTPVASVDGITHRWRHKNCSIFLPGPGINCVSCHQLYITFERIKRRHLEKPRKKSLNSMIKNLRQQNSRLTKKNLLLENALLILKEDLKRIQ